MMHTDVGMVEGESDRGLVFPGGALISRKINPPYLRAPAELRLVESGLMPPLELITAAHVLAFNEESLVLVRHERRGWTIPGGHLDPGESAQAAAHREVSEEASVLLGGLLPIAYWQYCCGGERPVQTKYPWPESYMQLYAAKVEVIETFAGLFETKERVFVPLLDLAAHEWGRAHPDMLQLIESARRQLGLQS